jgi:hypothetical protein
LRDARESIPDRPPRHKGPGNPEWDKRHEIRNTGSQPLRTLNVYVPPAYTAEGDERPAGRA